MDWLTRGTLTVSPMPVADAAAAGLAGAGRPIADSLHLRAARLPRRRGRRRSSLAFFLVQRAYGGPWGRMMRAIRDNHIAAASMGKNVTAPAARDLHPRLGADGHRRRHAGVSFSQIYDPGAYQPINHTFLIWVMVIVGGAGNNWGAVFGALLIYLTWMISDPVSQCAVQRHQQSGRPTSAGAPSRRSSRAPARCACSCSAW